MSGDNLAQWWGDFMEASRDRQNAVEHAYQSFENAGLINRVAVLRYLCDKGSCKLATVIKVSGRTIVRTRDNKYSRGLNIRRSVPAAREKNTLDGERHWPGHTFDITDEARWQSLRLGMNCRHRERWISATDILEATEGLRPGAPAAPIRL